MNQTHGITVPTGHVAIDTGVAHIESGWNVPLERRHGLLKLQLKMKRASVVRSNNK
jgi:hypothetical protein